MAHQQLQCNVISYTKGSSTPSVSTGRSLHHSDLNDNRKEKKMVTVVF